TGLAAVLGGDAGRAGAVLAGGSVSVAIRLPMLSCGGVTADCPDASGGILGSGVGVLGRVPPDKGGAALPYSPMLGSGASRTSGSKVCAGSRLALSTNGMGTLVTNSATATAATSP